MVPDQRRTASRTSVRGTGTTCVCARAAQITSRFPNVHGAPIHIGAPEAIGVDLSKRYQNVGDPEVGDDELPVFWACGLTPQLAVKNARPLLCITHAPSCMLISDLRNSTLAIL